MKIVFVIGLLLFQSSIFAQAAENYSIDSAAVEHKGVPKGEVMKFTFDSPKYFPVHGVNTGYIFRRNTDLKSLPVFM